MNLKQKLVSGAGLVLFASPAMALAQSSETPDFNPEALQQATQDLEKATQAAAKGGVLATGIFGAFAGFLIIGVIIGLIWLALWIWALIDVIRRTFKGSQKTTWLILIIASLIVPMIPFIQFLGFVSWLVPIIYLIVGRKQGTVGKSAPIASIPTPPPAK